MTQRRTAAASHDHLAQMTRQIAQLVGPFTTGTRQTVHRRVYWIALHHEPLLDQLRQAVTASDSGAVTETIRRRHRESQPPHYDEDAAETLSTIYIGISLWHSRLHLPSPDRALDWQKAALRQLATALEQVDEHGVPTIAPSIADDLTTAIDHWWEAAARASGWQPEDLRHAQPNRPAR